MSYVIVGTICLMIGANLGIVIGGLLASGRDYDELPPDWEPVD